MISTSLVRWLLAIGWAGCEGTFTGGGVGFTGSFHLFGSGWDPRVFIPPNGRLLKDSISFNAHEHRKPSGIPGIHLHVFVRSKITIVFLKVPVIETTSESSGTFIFESTSNKNLSNIQIFWVGISSQSHLWKMNRIPVLLILPRPGPIVHVSVTIVHSTSESASVTTAKTSSESSSVTAATVHWTRAHTVRRAITKVHNC